MRNSPSLTPIDRLETIALSVTRGIGSIWSVIIHTLLFVSAFILILFGVDLERVLLVLTTIVSLEAIYLSIFIQMSVNHQSKALASVEKEIDEIAEDVEEIQEDVEEIAEDVEEIAEDVDEIQEDVEEMQEDIDEIQEDVEEMQEEEQLQEKIMTK
jgi:peptidoglycan hydrolase CwlO-like protein